MNPSSFRIWAIDVLMFDAGIDNELWRACKAFRTRVNMSAIGSVGGKI
jgi:hypothetical protein